MSQQVSIVLLLCHSRCPLSCHSWQAGFKFTISKSRLVLSRQHSVSLFHFYITAGVHCSIVMLQHACFVVSQLVGMQKMFFKTNLTKYASLDQLYEYVPKGVTVRLQVGHIKYYCQVQKAHCLLLSPIIKIIKNYKQNHVLSKYKKMYSCTVCGKAYKHRQSLYRHVKCECQQQEINVQQNSSPVVFEHPSSILVVGPTLEKHSVLAVL